MPADENELQNTEPNDKNAGNVELNSAAPKNETLKNTEADAGHSSSEQPNVDINVDKNAGGENASEELKDSSARTKQSYGWNDSSRPSYDKILPQDEPAWLLILGSVVPALAIAAYAYALWHINFNSPLSTIPHAGSALTKIASTALVWFGLVNLIYSVIAYTFDFLALFALVRRPLGRTLALAYSLRAWKASGFILAFAAAMFFVYASQLWLAALPVMAIALFIAALSGFVVGAAVLELAHKVHVSVARFFVLLFTELLALVATAYASVALFAFFPK
jgi:hypothetical protein